MPRLSVWFIRSALLYLSVGVSLGGLMLWNKGVPVHPAIWRLRPAHIEFLLLGWSVQLLFGVAYWILPRFRAKRRKSKLVWFAFWLLNAGIWLVVVSSLIEPTALRPAGRLMETGAVVAFAIHAWPRVKAFDL